MSPTLPIPKRRRWHKKSRERIISSMKKTREESNKEMKNYNSKKEDLEEEDQRQDERNVIL